jgi:hypothetical protein
MCIIFELQVIYRLNANQISILFMLANIQVVYIDVVLSLFNIIGKWETKLCLAFGILSIFPSVFNCLLYPLSYLAIMHMCFFSFQFLL